MSVADTPSQMRISCTLTTDRNRPDGQRGAAWRVLGDNVNYLVYEGRGDFGTGYSALSHLTDLPVDEVKLDRSFVGRNSVDRGAALVVSTITDLAHRLDLVVVAEGVESAQPATRLRDLGCDILQGYYLGAPMTSTS